MARSTLRATSLSPSRLPGWVSYHQGRCTRRSRRRTRRQAPQGALNRKSTLRFSSRTRSSAGLQIHSALNVRRRLSTRGWCRVKALLTRLRGAPQRGYDRAHSIDIQEGEPMAKAVPVAMTPVAAVVRHVEWLEFALAAARDEETRRRERLAQATDKNREKRTVRLAEVTAEVRELGALVQGLKNLQARPAAASRPAGTRRRSQASAAKSRASSKTAAATRPAAAAAATRPAAAAAATPKASTAVRPRASATKPRASAAKPKPTTAAKPKAATAAKPKAASAKPKTARSTKPRTSAAKPATTRAAKPATRRRAARPSAPS